MLSLVSLVSVPDYLWPETLNQLHCSCAVVGTVGVGEVWLTDPVQCVIVQQAVSTGLFSFFILSMYHPRYLKPHLLTSIHQLAICLDLSILVFTVLGLYTQEKDGNGSRLWDTLLTQGVAYATITCLDGIPMAVCLAFLTTL